MERFIPFYALFLAVFFFGLSTTRAQKDTEVSKLEAFYYNKCQQISGGTLAFEKLRNDAFALNSYFAYAFDFLPSERAIFCDSQRGILNLRIKEVANDLYPCLKSNEKFLPQFFRESFGEMLHFLCHHNGEFTKRFFNAEAQQCRSKIESSNSNDLDNCLNRIFSPTTDYLTKKDLCDDITVARKCFANLLAVQCPYANDLKSLNNVFFDYVSKPCNSSGFYYLSVFIVLGSMLMHLLSNTMQ